MSALELTDVFFILFLYNYAFPLLFVKPLHTFHKAKLQKFTGHALSTWIVRQKYSFHKVFLGAGVRESKSQSAHCSISKSVPYSTEHKIVQTKRQTVSFRATAGLQFTGKSCQ